MNKKIITIISCLFCLGIIVFLIIYTNSNAKTISSENTQTNSEASDKSPSVTGNVKIIENFHSPQLNNDRNIRIYLPPDYNSTNKKYPVIYMHDGQNLFDNSTSYSTEWEVDETLEKLYKQHKTKGIIVVGIDNTENRASEYNPFGGSSVSGIIPGKCDQYSDFIVNTLKPYIDSNYRTLVDRDNTAIIGSSYGGVASLYTAIKYKSVFGMVGVFSFANNVNPEAMNQYLKGNFTPTNLIDTKIYYYVGTNDGFYPSANDAYHIGRDNHLNTIKYVEDSGYHKEIYWAPRFKDCIEYFKLNN